MDNYQEIILKCLTPILSRVAFKDLIISSIPRSRQAQSVNFMSEIKRSYSQYQLTYPFLARTIPIELEKIEPTIHFLFQKIKQWKTLEFQPNRNIPNVFLTSDNTLYCQYYDYQITTYFNKIMSKFTKVEMEEISVLYLNYVQASNTISVSEFIMLSIQHFYHNLIQNPILSTSLSVDSNGVKNWTTIPMIFQGAENPLVPYLQDFEPQHIFMVLLFIGLNTENTDYVKSILQNFVLQKIETMDLKYLIEMTKTISTMDEIAKILIILINARIINKEFEEFIWKIIFTLESKMNDLFLDELKHIVRIDFTDFENARKIRMLQLGDILFPTILNFYKNNAVTIEMIIVKYLQNIFSQQWIQGPYGDGVLKSSNWYQTISQSTMFNWLKIVFSRLPNPFHEDNYGYFQNYKTKYQQIVSNKGISILLVSLHNFLFEFKYEDNSDNIFELKSISNERDDINVSQHTDLCGEFASIIFPWLNVEPENHIFFQLPKIIANNDSILFQKLGELYEINKSVFLFLFIKLLDADKISMMEEFCNFLYKLTFTKEKMTIVSDLEHSIEIYLQYVKHSASSHENFEKNQKVILKYFAEYFKT